jgi:hypothetical protein
LPAVGAQDYARRGFQRVTSSARALPDFVIIGGMRCGSTALFDWISRHPDVRGPHPKEIHFFDVNFHRGVGWYRSFFPRRVAGRKTLEASPSYLAHVGAPRRAASVLPEARLIALLREPAERAWSHYRFRRSRGQEDRSFSAAIREELAAPMVSGMESFAAPGAIPYLLAGMYAAQLDRWFEAYDRDRVLVLFSDRMFDEPEAVLQRIEAFTGLAEVEIPLRPANVSPPAEPDPGLMAEIREYYDKPNRRLTELLDEPISWLESS